MKSKRNKLIKIGIFLFGVSVILWNCQQKEIITIPETSDYQTLIDPLVAIKEINQINTKHLASKTTQTSITNQIVFEQIDKEILARKKLNSDGTKIYSFYLERQLQNKTTNADRNYYDNLFVNIDLQNNIQYHLVRYIPNKEWLNSSRNQSTFSGDIQYLSLDKDVLASIEMKNGEQITNSKLQAKGCDKYKLVFVMRVCGALDGDSGGCTSYYKLIKQPCSGGGSSPNGSDDIENDNFNNNGDNISSSGGGSSGNNNFNNGGSGVNFGGNPILDKCSGDKIINPITRICECPEGKIEDSTGKCVKKQLQINCIKRTGFLHDSNFSGGKPILGNNVTVKSDNFRNDSWGLIQETNCGNGKIPKQSNVNVTNIDPVIRTLSNGKKLKYYRIEYEDCPKGNNKDNGIYDSNKPCSDCFKGNPLKTPEVAAQLGPSGIKGGMYGKTRSSNTKWHRGIDIKSEYGDAIYAMFDGTVTLAQQGDGTKGAGYYVILTSKINGKTVKSLYFHMQKDNRVSGDVKAGDIIGYQGDSGNLKSAIEQGYATSHLHVKIKENGVVVNPNKYMKTSFNATTGVATHSTDCN